MIMDWKLPAIAFECEQEEEDEKNYRTGGEEDNMLAEGKG